MKKLVISLAASLLILLLIPTVAMAADGTWENVGATAINNSSSYYESLFVYDNGSAEGLPYIAYADSANSFKATVKKFNGTAWETVGPTSISTGFALNISIYINNDGSADGVPYIAFEDNGTLTVLKFNGTAWETVGAGTLPTTNFPFSFFVYDDGSANGIPYLAFMDAYNFDAVSVMKFNGSAWETVGSTVCSFALIEHLSLFVHNDGSANGVPYVFYMDMLNDLPTVSKFNGTGWENVGTSGVTSDYTDKESLYVHDDGSSNGVPYVAYRDPNTANTFLKRFNGTTWENVGTGAVLTNQIEDISLYVYDDGSANGIPYLSYSDATASYSATVKKYNGTDWETLGTGAANAANTFYLSLFVYDDGSADGLPYLGYSDGINNYIPSVIKFVAANTLPNRISTVPEYADAYTAPTVAFTLDLSTIFEDADNDTLTYEVSEGGGGYIAANENYSFTSPYPGTLTFVFRAHDGTGYSTDLYVVTLIINTLPNRISSVPAADSAVTSLNTAYTLNLDTIFEDADYDTLTYQVNIDGAGYIAADESYSYPAAIAGTYDLVFRANDGIADSTDTYTVTLTVNTLPTRIAAVPAADTATVDVNSAYTLDLSTIFEDADGDTLSYVVDIDGAGNVAADENYSLTPTSAGDYVLVFTSNDGYIDSTDTYTLTLTAVNGNHTLTYDANGGTGTGSEMHTGTTTFSLKDGTGFALSGYVLDGWEIDGVNYLLAGLYQMPNMDMTAYAQWAADTDGDGVSDKDETIAGTNPSNPSDIPEKGTIKITVYNQDGTPRSGATCVLNSTPIISSTNTNGSVSFNDIYLASHILTLRDGNQVLGQYTFNFTQGSNNTAVITDDASTDSIGHMAITITDKYLYLDATIRQNAAGYWELSGASVITTADPVVNPSTGDDSREYLWILLVVLSAILAGSGALLLGWKAKKQLKI